MCLALDLVAVLASLEGLVVVGVPGGHEGLNESAKDSIVYLKMSTYSKKLEMHGVTFHIFCQVCPKKHVNFYCRHPYKFLF